MTTTIDSDALAKSLLSESGEHDRFSHYVKKKEVEYALANGVPCKALCGKYWIPTKDHKKYPVCPTCEQIYKTMKR